MRITRLTDSDARCVLGLHFRADGKALAAVLGLHRQPVEIVSWNLTSDRVRHEGYALEGGARLSSWPSPAFAGNLSPFVTFGQEDQPVRDYLTLRNGPADVRFDLGDSRYGLGAIAFEPGDRRVVAIAVEKEDWFGEFGSSTSSVAVAVLSWNAANLTANPRSGTRSFDAYNPITTETLPLSALRTPTAAAFSADGRFLAVGLDGMVELWRWPGLLHVGALFDARGNGREPTRRVTFDAKGETLLWLSDAGVGSRSCR